MRFEVHVAERTNRKWNQWKTLPTFWVEAAGPAEAEMVALDIVCPETGHHHDYRVEVAEELACI